MILSPTRELAERIVDELAILVLHKADRMLDMGWRGGRLAAASRNPLRHVHKPKVEEAAEVQHRFVHLRAPLFPALRFPEGSVGARGAGSGLPTGARGIVRRSRGEAKSNQSCGRW